MTDDKNLRGQQDRTQVNSGEAYEVEYLAKKLGVTPESVREAEQRVGKSRQKIEEYLSKKR